MWDFMAKNLYFSSNMIDSTQSNESVQNPTMEKSINSPNVLERCNPSLLKLISVYEKRLLQSSIDIEIGQVYDSVGCANLKEGIALLEQTVQYKIMAYIENKKQQEMEVQQRLKFLDKEIIELQSEEKQQRESVLALEHTLAEFNEQYELQDELDTELDDFAVATETLALALETNPKKVHGIFLSNIVLSSIPHFGKEVTCLQRLFMDAEKNHWSQLLGKQVGKCQEQYEMECPEETVGYFKKLLAEQGLHCSEREDLHIGKCIYKAIQLKRFYVAGYPDLINRVKTLHENRWKSSRNEKNMAGGWVRKLKKLTEK